MTDLRAASFWDWAVAAYAAPGVAPACIALQDGHGQNVPLLLWAAWRGSRGMGVDAGRAAELARAWEADVIAPLRAVRRRLKTEVTAGDDAVHLPLRDAVKATELQAERALMTHLAAIDGGGTGDMPANLRAVAAAWSGDAAQAAIDRLAAVLMPFRSDEN
ncbi:MAG: TIGR02444 family protein [Asticcacaulis sp.]